MRVTETAPSWEKRSFVIASAVAAVLVLLFTGCGGLPAGGTTFENTPGTLDGSDDPTLATEQITGVVVGFIGTGMVVENHSAVTLKSAVIIVNEGGAEGGFSFRIAELGPHTTNTYLRQVFRTPDGVSLNPNNTKVRKFTLYADVPTGRGVWRGAY